MRETAQYAASPLLRPTVLTKRGWPGTSPGHPHAPSPAPDARVQSPAGPYPPPLTAWSEIVCPTPNGPRCNKLFEPPAVLLHPFRAGPAHVVQLGPIRMEHVVRARLQLHGRGAEMLPH